MDTSGHGDPQGADLVIDVGNTRSKLGWFQQGRCMRVAAIGTGDTAALLRFVKGEAVRRIAVGAVADMRAWSKDLAELAPVLELSGDQPSPLDTGSLQRNTLGVDRLANAVAAHRTFPGRPVVAIGLGTCIVLDLVNAQGAYLGGAISPGMNMRSQAMNAFSARLPLTELNGTLEPLGTSTQGALLAGIHHGIVLELGGWIGRLRQQYPTIAVVLTGGDALRFSRALKSGIFADPALTLRGLHALLLHAHHADGPAGAARHR